MIFIFILSSFFNNDGNVTREGAGYLKRSSDGASRRRLDIAKIIFLCSFFTNLYHINYYK